MIDAVVALLKLHKYVTPPVAVKVALSPIQIATGFPASTAGGVMSCVTTVELDAVHPLDAVTVTVYVPGLVTVFVDDVPPPDQA